MQDQLMTIFTNMKGNPIALALLGIAILAVMSPEGSAFHKLLVKLGIYKPKVDPLSPTPAPVVPVASLVATPQGASTVRWSATVPPQASAPTAKVKVDFEFEEAVTELIKELNDNIGNLSEDIQRLSAQITVMSSSPTPSSNS